MTPRVSFVYLTRNGASLLRESLKSVFAQEAEFAFEVVVVDSGSTDGTLDMLKEFPVRLFSIPAEEFNFGLTRDYGFGLARGEILVPISQDVILASTDWLEKMTVPFADPKIALVQGTDVPNPRIPLFYWDRVGLFYRTRDVAKWMAAYDNVGVSFTVCAIRRQVWEEHRLGKVEMSEDKVFQRAIIANGHKIFREGNAFDHHSHTYDVVSLAKRSENEGLGWRNVDIPYFFTDMLKDMLSPIMLGALIYGLATLQIKSWAELLFPLIRPAYLYKGNNFTRQYVK